MALNHDNYDTLGPGYGVNDEDLCVATTPPALASGEDLCWLPEGHEGFHKSLAQTGPGWRVWVEWAEDPYPHYARRAIFGLDQGNDVRDFIEMMKGPYADEILAPYRTEGDVND